MEQLSNEAISELYSNLEERVFTFFKDEIAFSAADVERKFPDENKRSLYRALNKLEAENRIKFVKWHNRKKLYTAQGQSHMPRVKNATGQVAPIGVLPRIIESMFADGNPGKEIERFFILACQLFVIAQQDDPKRGFLDAHKEFIEIREYLMRMVENVDNILRHPAMMGDMELFRRSFATGTDPAIPKPEELLAFRKWLAKYMTEKRN